MAKSHPVISIGGRVFPDVTGSKGTLPRRNPPKTFSDPGGVGGTSITLMGPLFTGESFGLAQEMCDELTAAIVHQAYADVMTNLNDAIQHPTPYYETQITTERHGDTAVVHDRGIIYGPWLEGVGTRNQTTRFKGYFSFRRAAQTTQGKVGTLLAGVMARFMGRM